MSSLQPARDYVIIELEEAKYAGTLIIPDPIKDAPVSGIVTHVGPGHEVRATAPHEVTFFDPLLTKVGDHVLFNKYSGSDIEWEGKKLLLTRESEIICYIQEES